MPLRYCAIHVVQVITELNVYFCLTAIQSSMTDHHVYVAPTNSDPFKNHLPRIPRDAQKHQTPVTHPDQHQSEGTLCSGEADRPFGVVLDTGQAIENETADVSLNSIIFIFNLTNHQVQRLSA